VNRETTVTCPTARRPGLPVSLVAWSDDDDRARHGLQARVDEGSLPLALSLYVDGDLVDTADGACAVHDFVVPDLASGRHAVTVRAVDGTGRWGGASLVVDARTTAPCAAVYR
jgi:hypothetical protein